MSFNDSVLVKTMWKRNTTALTQVTQPGPSQDKRRQLSIDINNLPGDKLSKATELEVTSKF